MNTPSLKDTLEALSKYVTNHRYVIEERHKLQWKVFFGAVTFYTLFAATYNTYIYSLIRYHANLYKFITLIVILLFFIAIYWTTYGFMKRFQEANSINKHVTDETEILIIDILKGQHHYLPPHLEYIKATNAPKDLQLTIARVLKLFNSGLLAFGVASYLFR